MVLVIVTVQSGYHPKWISSVISGDNPCGVIELDIPGQLTLPLTYDSSQVF